MGCLFYTFSLVFSAGTVLSFIWIVLELINMVFRAQLFDWTSVWVLIINILGMVGTFLIAMAIQTWR